MKSSKNVPTVLLGDSIVAGFLRHPNIWYKFFNENTTNYGIGGDKIQNVLWRAEYVLINCGTNNLDTDNSEKITDGIFCIALTFQEKNKPSQDCEKWNSTS